jgi:hypothetical protein
LKNISIQSSVDGINFTDIGKVDSGQYHFTNSAYQQSDLYYRLKITSITERVVYSNTIVLDKVNRPSKTFAVSTYVTGDLIINAFENFKYRMTNLNGNSVKNGNGAAGCNRINISGSVSGIYILEMFGSNGRQTEKIMKQ